MLNKCRQAIGIVQARVLRKPVPVNIGFELTHRCNLDCVYCDRHTAGPGELSLDEIKKTLDAFHGIGTRALSLDGGEPLVRQDFPEIVEHIDKLGLELRINTNGILVPRRVALLRRASKLKVSLDGDQADHDAMRGVGSFRKALTGIEKAREQGIEVELTCVLHNDNLRGVPRLLRLAEQLDAPIVFQPIRTSLVSYTPAARNPWAPQAEALRATFKSLLSERRTNRYVANRKSSLVHFMRFPEHVHLPCAAGWINCLVDPQGVLYHCAQVDRQRHGVSSRRHGVKAAFELLRRFGCTQCWCARTVEENYAWGLVSPG